LAAERLAIQPGLEVPVARIEHLIALKVLARDDEKRPQDRADLVVMLAEASPDEIARGREALQLITARQFHRGKDLLSSLDELYRQSGLSS